MVTYLQSQGIYGPEDLGWDPGDPPEFRIFKSCDRTARKTISCTEGGCPGYIPPGQRYHEVVGLEDGQFFRIVHCAGKCHGVDIDPYANPTPGAGVGQ